MGDNGNFILFFKKIYNFVCLLEQEVKSELAVCKINDARRVNAGCCLDFSTYQQFTYEFCAKPLIINMRGLGGMGSLGFEFNSLDEFVKKQFDINSSDYRLFSNGLSFSSVCRNPRCRANGNTVCVNKGFGTFSIDREAFNLQCPACHHQSAPSTNCGFYMAKWEFSGRKRNGGNISLRGYANTNEYYTLKEGDNEAWMYLQVTVAPLN